MVHAWWLILCCRPEARTWRGWGALRSSWGTRCSCSLSRTGSDYPPSGSQDSGPRDLLQGLAGPGTLVFIGRGTHLRNIFQGLLGTERCKYCTGNWVQLPWLSMPRMILQIATDPSNLRFAALALGGVRSCHAATSWQDIMRMSEAMALAMQWGWTELRPAKARQRRLPCEVAPVVLVVSFGWLADFLERCFLDAWRPDTCLLSDVICFGLILWTYGKLPRFKISCQGPLRQTLCRTRFAPQSAKVTSPRGHACSAQAPGARDTDPAKHASSRFRLEALPNRTINNTL